MESSDPNEQQDDILSTNSDQEEDEWRMGMEPQQLVFGIDLLREMILDLAIREGGQFSRANALSCRLVHRSWHHSVSKCLSRSAESLFHFNLVAKADLAPESSINQFLAAYGSSSRLLESIPPFGLNLNAGNPIPVEKLKEVLEKCLRWCASGLMGLQLNFYSYDIKAPAIPDGLSLPVLHKLCLTFSDSFSRRVEEDFLKVVGVQAILSASKKLKHFTFAGVKMIPVSLNTLRLPNTLTTLVLKEGLTFKHLEQLSRSNVNTFPKLTSLTLYTPNQAYDGKDSIYHILTKVSLTLQTFHLGGGGTGPEGWEKTPLRFPTMKCLESVFVSAFNWKLACGPAVNFRRSLPLTTQFKFAPVSPSALRHLVENARFETAKKLDIFLIVEISNTIEDLPPAVARLHQAFPNITVLDLALLIPFDRPRVLHQLLQNMPQLEKFKLFCSYAFVLENHDRFWSTMFLGMSPEEMTPATIPYITKMSELRYFTLNLGAGYLTVLPDSVFELGLLKMPKLLYLKLMGNFKASPEMEEKWRLAGRGEIYYESKEEEIRELERRGRHYIFYP